MLCGDEAFNKGIKGEWMLSMTNICTRTKQVKTIFIWPDLQMLRVPFLPQKQDTNGSAFTISKDSQKCGRVEKYLRLYNLGDHKTSRRVWKLFRFMSWCKSFRHPHSQNLFHKSNCLKIKVFVSTLSAGIKKKKEATTFNRCSFVCPQIVKS